jgi:hypothetical protein
MTESQVLNVFKYVYTGQDWVHAVALLSCIREAPGSKLERYTEYPNSFRSFPLLRQANAAVVGEIKPGLFPSTYLQFISHPRLVTHRCTVVVTDGGVA